MSVAFLCGCNPEAEILTPEAPGAALFGKGGNKGGGKGGGGGTPITLAFILDSPSDVVEGASDTLNGSNRPDGVTASGDYTLTYTLPAGSCQAGGLVELFDGVALAGNLELTADRVADASGSYEPPERARVTISGLKNPADPGDKLKYSVSFDGDLQQDADIFDPDQDIQFTESGTSSTVSVADEGITVSQIRGKNVIASERCRGVAHYTFVVTPALPLPAFPGAEGFGALATGGRGGAVHHVTNLNDAGPGSLRAALEATGPRTVVFDIGGTIELASTLQVTNGDFTIAGQTAPGGGITISRQMVWIAASNFIIRHVRFRRGIQAAEDPATLNDALKIGDATNGIVDHCSISWGGDEVLDFGRTSTDITIQWCAISEALDVYDHGFGISINPTVSSRLSMHHNLIAHHVIRLPTMSFAPAPKGLTLEIDFRNNVRYNWVQGSQIRNNDSPQSTLQVNYVGNYSLKGPSTQPPWFDEAARGNPDNKAEFVQVYQSDNVINGVDLGINAFGNQDKLTFVGSPFTYPPEYAVTTVSPATAYAQVLQSVGATHPARDAVDSRVIAEVQNGTGGIINTQDDVGGWPPLAPGSPPVDSDGDGMPDSWESDRGLDPNDPSDGNEDRNGDRYTNLEEYLEWLISG